MRREKIKFIILRTLGNFFLLFSLFGMIMTFGPALYFEVLYRVREVRNVKYIVAAYPTPTPPTPTFKDFITPQPTEAPKTTLFGQLTGGDKTEILSPVSAQFGLVIPKIGANVQIFPNVDAGKPNVYLPILQKGVAHAAGSVFPGVSGNIYLFAHSTDAFWNVGRYNAIFYLLKELDKNDEVDVFFLGVRHIYKVVDKLIVDPSQVQYLTIPVPYEQLSLQTCWPPGTTLKRLIVLARLEGEVD